MGSFGNRRGSRKQAAQGKISLRLLEFAEPMIDEAFEGDGDPTATDLESVLKLVVTIWNAKVMEQIGRGSGHVEEIERVMFQDPRLPPKAKFLTKLMLERKTTEFPDDLRLIGDFRVYTAPDGEMRVKAEARLASELRHEH
jgi:hypothetical protein